MQIRVETRRGGYHQPLSDHTSSPSARLLLVFFFLEISVVKALTQAPTESKMFCCLKLDFQKLPAFVEKVISVSCVFKERF